MLSTALQGSGCTRAPCSRAGNPKESKGCLPFTSRAWCKIQHAQNTHSIQMQQPQVAESTFICFQRGSNLLVSNPRNEREWLQLQCVPQSTAPQGGMLSMPLEASQPKHHHSHRHSPLKQVRLETSLRPSPTEIPSAHPPPPAVCVG